MNSQTSIEIIVLISIWIVGHLCLVGAVQDKYKQTSLLAVLLCMVVVYSIKPATMDLFGYSVYFDTGYWPASGYSGDPGGFQVEDIRDGDSFGIPYIQRFPNEVGFTTALRWLASVLPHGQFLPRLTAMGREYTSDALVFIVIAIGLCSFVVAIWNFLSHQLRSQERRRFLLISTPIALGSVFFFVGSQNAIRQFLMISLCMLAKATMLASFLTHLNFSFISPIISLALSILTVVLISSYKSPIPISQISP